MTVAPAGTSTEIVPDPVPNMPTPPMAKPVPSANVMSAGPSVSSPSASAGLAMTPTTAAATPIVAHRRRFIAFLQPIEGPLRRDPRSSSSIR